jgi:hypothetical protein
MADRDRRREGLDPVKQASLESFPASDPPGWVPMRSGLPARAREHVHSEGGAGPADRIEDGVPSDPLSAHVRVSKRSKIE